MSGPMSGPVSVVVVAAVEAVARQCASVRLLLDLPDAVVVSYDPRPRLADTVRRTVTDRSGVVEEEVTPLGDGCCLSCTVREDVLATVTMLVDTRRWQTVVVALPLTAAPEPVAFQINLAIADQQLTGAVLTSVVAVVDLDTLEDDLLGDDLLDERGLALGGLDRRSVGEAVASQIEFADVVVTVAPGPAAAEALLSHIVAPTSQLHVGWHQVHAPDLVHRRHDSDIARNRVDPLKARPNGACDTDDVWTVELTTSQPLHPARLLHQIEDLGGGRIRARGYFWLPSRPGTACVWDGSGGQLSIGHVGPWRHRRPGTRLVVTGIDHDERRRIERSFASVVATADELTTHHRWVGAEDGFEPWLGGLQHQPR